MNHIFFFIILFFLLLSVVATLQQEEEGEKDEFEMDKLLDGEEDGFGEGDEDGMDMEGFDEERIAEMLKGMPGGGQGMFGGGGGGMGFAQRQEMFNAVIPLDTPFVLCEACRALVERVFELVKQRRESFKKTKVNEYHISELINHVCEPRSDLGKWLTEYAVIPPGDLTVQSPRFSLQKMPGPGFCEESCWLLENACQNIIENAETDLIEQLWVGKLSKEQLSEQVCGEFISELKGSCDQPYPQMSKQRRSEERKYTFRQKSEMDLEFDKASESLSTNTEL